MPKPQHEVETIMYSIILISLLKKEGPMRMEKRTLARKRRRLANVALSTTCSRAACNSVTLTNNAQEVDPVGKY